MKNPLLFNFSVDKENKKIYVKREFAADLDRVWAAWTKPELLDQWWAPKPWKAKTKSLDFRDGGRWLYAMVSPEGEEHWSLADYSNIEDKKQFSNLNAFCDENGVITNGISRSQWTNTFTGNGDSTTVNIDITYETVEALEKMIEMGFKEGFTMGLGNLEALLDSGKA
ncbi:SRPBCC family protein [Flavobacterium silvaticum]|uniref:SRPBCC domain-containing protein n=1 Tax=Flavobacterium silvaticum TaxID=1852020 RepID=A0A972JH59_9FLAO|nr:SRPBCC domain-containing protein [Flavobacterium silvaticum]NMH26773.1 SRPBCC domain-containing protein [Flavobacterium silvaticum]